MTLHLSVPGTDILTYATCIEGCHSFCCTLPFKWVTFVPKGFSLMGLSAVHTQFFSLNRQRMREKDKAEYCVSLQAEEVTVLKKTSLMMSFTEQNLQQWQLKHCRQPPVGCRFPSGCSVFKVKMCYFPVWQEMRESKAFHSASGERGKSNHIYEYIDNVFAHYTWGAWGALQRSCDFGKIPFSSLDVEVTWRDCPW